jgi:predicted PurR-regulated permease PerM
VATMGAPTRRLRIAPVLTATALTVLLLWLFGAAADVFLLLFAGILVSLYLGALTDLIVRRLRVPRALAFATALIATLAAIVALFWILVPPVVEQTKQLVSVVPGMIAGWENRLQAAAERIPALQGIVKPGEHPIVAALYEQLAHLFDNALPRVTGLFHAIINVFSVIVMAIYLTVHPAEYREWLIAFFPPLHRDLVRDVLDDLGTQLRAWIVSQLIAMFTLAILTAIGLYVLQVPYWLTFGMFTGAVAIVPFFGTLVSSVVPGLFVLGGAGIWGLSPTMHALFVIALGFVIHIVEANLIVPLIVANKVKLPPVLTIMAVLVVGKLMGPAGLLVAVPTLVVLMVVTRRILWNRIYLGQGFRRAARDRILVLRVPPPDGGILLPVGDPVDLVAESERARPAARPAA